ERTPPRPVSPSAGDRRDEGNHQAGECQGPTELDTGTVAEELGGRDVDGEDEGGDDRVEGSRAPVPQAPRQDCPLATAHSGRGSGDGVGHGWSLQSPWRSRMSLSMSVRSVT